MRDVDRIALFSLLAIVLVFVVLPIPPTPQQESGGDWEAPENDSAIRVYSVNVLNESGDVTRAFDAGETVTVEYKIENVGGESGEVERVAEIYGPWNASTGHIETDYYRSSNISVGVPAEGHVVVTTELMAPSDPGEYQIDVGPSSYGCVIDDGIRRIEVVGGEDGE